MVFSEKVIFIYEIPVNFARYLTIPPFDENSWNKN